MSQELFLSCDWGTSNVRLRLAALHNSKVLAELSGPEGAAVIAGRTNSPAERAEAFEQTLRGMAAELLGSLGDDLPVVVSGMATSTIGWKEIPAVRTPLSLSGKELRCVLQNPAGEAFSGPIYLTSGLRTERDAMRGEEIQIVGLFADPQSGVQKHADHAVVILPGTHSKHAHIKHEAVIDFDTYVTGELFAVLGTHSILRHSVDPQLSGNPPVAAEFERGVRESTDAALARVLFQVRTNQILQQRGAAENTSYFLGALIGSELSELRKRRGAETPIGLAAGKSQRGFYETALEILQFKTVISLPPEHTDGLVVSGQRQLLRIMREE